MASRQARIAAVVISCLAKRERERERDPPEEELHQQETIVGRKEGRDSIGVRMELPMLIIADAHLDEEELHRGDTLLIFLCRCGSPFALHRSCELAKGARENSSFAPLL